MIGIFDIGMLQQVFFFDSIIVIDLFIICSVCDFDELNVVIDLIFGLVVGLDGVVWCVVQFFGCFMCVNQIDWQMGLNVILCLNVGGFEVLFYVWDQQKGYIGGLGFVVNFCCWGIDVVLIDFFGVDVVYKNLVNFNKVFVVWCMVLNGVMCQDLFIVDFVSGNVELLNYVWNMNLLKLGVYSFWVDGSGKVWIKNGMLVNDMDGMVIGMQM